MLEMIKDALRRFVSSTSVKSVGKVVGGNIATSLISMIASVLVARWTLPYDMGIWNTALLVTVYAPVIQFGVFSGLGRELPYLFGTGKSEKAMEMAQTAYAWALSLSALTMASAVLVSSAFWANGLGRLAATSVAIGTIVACSWLSFYLGTTYRTHSEFGRLAKNNTLVAVVGIPLTILVLRWGYSGLIIRAAIISLFSLAVLYFRRPIDVRPVWNKLIFYRLVKIGAPIWMVGQLGAFFITLDRFVLVAVPQVLGYFTVAIQTAVFSRSIPIAFTVVLYPKMAHKYGENHNAMDIWYMARKGAVGASLLGLFVGLCGWFILPKFVEIILPKYVPGISAAQYAAFLGLAMGCYVFDNVYNIIGRQDAYVANWVVGVLVFYATWYVLTDILSLPKGISSAQSMLFATSVMAISSAVISRRLCVAHDRLVSVKS